jgi:hypothetical protein
MRRIAVLIALAAISASTIPAVAAECTSNKDIDASCARRTTVQSQPADVASFYESAMLRQVAAKRLDGTRVLVALDSVINAFNDLLATKCGG